MPQTSLFLFPSPILCSPLPSRAIICISGWFALQATINDAGKMQIQAAQNADDPGLRWTCVAAILAFPEIVEGLGLPVIIRYRKMVIGAPLLRAYYTVFRRNGPNDYSVGFAPSV